MIITNKIICIWHRSFIVHYCSLGYVQYRTLVSDIYDISQNSRLMNTKIASKRERVRDL